MSTDNQLKTSCFHCGLEHDFDLRFSVVIDSINRSMCCPGCQAVAQTICDAGLDDYYRFREPSKALKPHELIPDELIEAQIYEQEAIRDRYVTKVDEDHDNTTLMLEGLSCAACVWLIESQLKKTAGVVDIDINFTRMSAQVAFQPSIVKLSEIITAIARLGYRARPYQPRMVYQSLLRERKEQIKRLGITALLGMQVMTLAVALYFGAFTGIEDEWKFFFQKVALLLTLPVLFYSAQTFFKSSVQQIMRLQPGIDVPVSIGLLLAFGASVWSTITGTGEIYYDSVVMFVFLLLLSRFFMHSARLNAAQNTERLALSNPLSAKRLETHHIDAIDRTVSGEELKAGDWIRVLPGYTIAADGIVIDGHSNVNQALISGESKPVSVKPSDTVIAGSVNNDHSLIIEVRACGENTVLFGIERLAQQSLNAKAPSITFIDTIARWFVLFILLLACSTALYWFFHEPSRTLAITVAVLVVSCPCALSMAVPTAHATANNYLIQKGILISQPQALERLSQVNHVIFDKTGTLTQDFLQLDQVKCFNDHNRQDALKLAASLEVFSDHPLAKSISHAHPGELYHCEQWQSITHRGVQACINKHTYYLGSAAFIRSVLDKKDHSSSQFDALIAEQSDNQAIQIFLANEDQLIAQFCFSDSIRDGVQDLIDYFTAKQIPITMLTGDHPTPAQYLAHKIGIDHVLSACSPVDKLDFVKQLQNDGIKTLMIGDGINDSPVLAAAWTSIAVAGASPLAVSGAEIVMVNPRIDAVIALHKKSIMTHKIIRQNILWALSYNLCAIPIAIAGFVQPLFAAAGMSISSLIVVFNALRLKKDND